MSYCRWSSDNYKSDVYVYKDTHGGWTTHVAASKRLGLDTLPPFPYDYGVSNEEWNKAYQDHFNVLENLPMAPIGLPHDGKRFNDPTPQACADTLKMLKEVGYHVPDGVIEELEKEEKEEHE